MHSATNEPLNCQVIDALYEEGPLLDLDPELLASVLAFFAEHQCDNVGGALLFSERGSVEDTHGMWRKNLLSRRRDTFKGPAIIGGRYYPNGIGIWTSGDLGPIR
ncbi:hypothetical protein [Mycobacterium sp. BK086]|uniref:hypothetical protein n=1 Tax=Mycobacterium sp. BK086 TaxID=2512165 RepID=UPI00105F52DD|nr:hypothetical protein [Mycobacterium sp. BK086]